MLRTLKVALLLPVLVASGCAGAKPQVTSSAQPAVSAARTAPTAVRERCETIVTDAAASAAGERGMAVPAELDRYIACEMHARQIPGAALAIARNGRILTQRAYGLASIQNDAPVTTRTRFAIASVTKPITAIGIMLLVQDGKVELDAPVSRYLTEAPAAWHAMTVRHLLNHTSGLPEIGHGWAEWENQDREDLLRLGGLQLPTEPLYRIALQDTLWFAPGTDWAYSDVGYFLLGVVTERASGMSWRDFIRDRIFEPLDMSDSYISDIWTIYSDEARGYTVRDGVLSNIRRDRIPETPSHYGIFSNAGDLAKLDAALNTDRLLSEESRRTMWAPTQLPGGETFPYALGWEVWSFRGHRTQYHGGITGAEFLRLPDDSLAVVLLTNLGHGTRYGMSQNVAKLLIPSLKRPALRDVPIAEAELRRYAGRYSAVSGEPFEVTLVDGRLVAPYPWPFPRRGGEAALVHQGDHTFEFVDHDGRIVFRLAEDGAVAGLSAVAWDGGYRSDYRRTAETRDAAATGRAGDAAAARTGQTTRYVELLAGREVGEQLVTRGDDGVTEVVYHYKNNGRGPELRERFTLADDGAYRTWEVSGNSEFGAPVDESFIREGDRVRRKSTSNRASSRSPAPRIARRFGGTPATRSTSTHVSS
jgi:CubicO group peptidase (beta-lactamase class C family)